MHRRVMLAATIVALLAIGFTETLPHKPAPMIPNSDDRRRRDRSEKQIHTISFATSYNISS
jgi:hypothetical protein